MLTTVCMLGQGVPRAHFFGLNPGVTVEPEYNTGEFDVNIVPIVYQRTVNKRVDFRATSIVNYGVRNDNNGLSHCGFEMAFPTFISKKESKSNLSNGFFLAPIVSLTRDLGGRQNIIGVWAEPGYNLLFDNSFAMTFGLQFGATYFIKDSSESEWGSHFGVKILIGRWFNLKDETANK